MSLQNGIIDASTMLGLHPQHRLDMSVDSLVANMQKHDIIASLAISTVGIFHSYKSGNEITLEATKDDPRIIPMATINPTNYFGDASDLQSICKQGFRIFKFFPAIQEWHVGSRVFKQILKQLGSMNIPVVIDHPTPDDMIAVAAAIAEHSAPIILSSITIDLLSEVLVLMQECSNIYMETDNLHVTGGLEFLKERIGADRIIFGSGAPRRSMASSLNYIQSSELSDEDKSLILGQNMRKILEGA